MSSQLVNGPATKDSGNLSLCVRRRNHYGMKD
nr:unnamed protein product [Callosobruchus chinensis]